MNAWPMTDEEREQARWWFAQQEWADRIRMFRGTRKTATIRGEILMIDHLDVRANLVLEGNPNYLPAYLRDCLIAGDFTCDSPETRLDDCVIYGVIAHPNPSNLRHCVIFDHAEHRGIAWPQSTRVERYSTETIP